MENINYIVYEYIVYEKTLNKNYYFKTKVIIKK